MSDELELEILSYREFRNRETLLAWERRRRLFEARLGRRGIEPELTRPRGGLRPREQRRVAGDGARR